MKLTKKYHMKHTDHGVPKSIPIVVGGIQSHIDPTEDDDYLINNDGSATNSPNKDKDDEVRVSERLLHIPERRVSANPKQQPSMHEENREMIDPQSPEPASNPGIQSPRQKRASLSGANPSGVPLDRPSGCRSS